MEGFTVIAACDSAGGIGRNNDLPWKLPGDMKYFRRITTDPAAGRPNVVIMGRRTWESLPESAKPLAGRHNVIITTSSPLPGVPLVVDQVHSFDQAVDCYCQQRRAEYGQVFVIGGARIYDQALCHPLCRRILLTRIEGDFGCDKFLPPLPAACELSTVSAKHNENGITYCFAEFVCGQYP